MNIGRWLWLAALSGLVATGVFAVSFQEAWSRNGGSKTMSDTVTVECVAAGRVDNSLLETVCGELTERLHTTYKNNRFVAEFTPDAMKLRVLVHNATPAGLGMQFIWETKDGRLLEGKKLSIVTMDKPMDFNRRSSLYHRLIAETPMPV
jgi:hypothetical protein